MQSSSKCKKKVLYYNKFSEELPVTTEKKGTSLLISLLINKEDSSDEEIDKQ